MTSEAARVHQRPGNYAPICANRLGACEQSSPRTGSIPRRSLNRRVAQFWRRSHQAKVLRYIATCSSTTRPSSAERIATSTLGASCVEPVKQTTGVLCMTHCTVECSSIARPLGLLLSTQGKTKALWEPLRLPRLHGSDYLTWRNSRSCVNESGNTFSW